MCIRDSAEVEDRPEGCGEDRYEIQWMGKRSYAFFLVKPEIWKLAERRCRFIAERQQCRDRKSCLDGAYLIYDNEEGTQYYSCLLYTSGFCETSDYVFTEYAFRQKQGSCRPA